MFAPLIFRRVYNTQGLESNDPRTYKAKLWGAKVGAAIQEQLCCFLERSGIARAGFVRGGHAYGRNVRVAKFTKSVRWNPVGRGRPPESQFNLFLTGKSGISIFLWLEKTDKSIFFWLGRTDKSIFFLLGKTDKSIFFWLEETDKSIFFYWDFLKSK